MKYENPITYAIQKIWPMLKFLKVGQTLRSRSQGQKIWYVYKGLVIRKTHMKYESPNTCHSKDMANVKVFQDRQTGKQTDRPKTI
jgi:hypothetical protein